MHGSNVTQRQQAQSALSKIVSGHLADIRRSPDFLKNLLNDYSPETPHERFMLVSAVECRRFRSVLKNGTPSAFDLQMLQQELEAGLCFSVEAAQWISDSWRLALNILNEPRLSGSFECPHCHNSGVAERYWTNQRMICPFCNSQLKFSNELKPSVFRSGWKVKRNAGGDWTMFGANAKADTPQLNKRIWDFLNDERFDSEQVADAIGLRQIVSSLSHSTEQILNELGRSRTREDFGPMVKAILKANISETNIHLAPNIPEQFLLHLGEVLTVENPSSVIGILSRMENQASSCAFVFSCNRLWCCQDGQFWSVPFREIKNLGVKLEASITDLRIGDRRVMSVQGTGIPRRDLGRAIQMLADCSLEYDLADSKEAK
jgi:hypothetical protein